MQDSARIPASIPSIPYGHQEIREEDIAAVEKILRSDFLTQGEAVPAFEQALCRYCGARYAVAVNSATSALHLACRALDVGPGDRVWTTPITFVASANCALYCGAEVDFVDIDGDTFNISCDALEEKLRQAKKANRLPKVVIPVHFAGRPVEQQRIGRLAEEYGFSVIEDASHAIGAVQDIKRGERVGGCHYSDITVFSFHPVKIITTGEGGAAMTNNPQLAEKMARLRSHGIIRNKEIEQEYGEWYYRQVDLGYNYRMTDIQAALGSSQLLRLEGYIKKRNELAKRYNRELASLPLTLPPFAAESISSWHLYVIRLGSPAVRKEVFAQLRKMGIGVNVHYIPLYHQPYYQRLGFERGYCPAAEEYYARAITLPLFAAMTGDEQDRVIGCLSFLIGNIYCTNRE